MNKKLTIEYVRSEFEKEGCTLLSEEYVNAQVKLNYVCKNGHEHSITWRSWKHGHRCPTCDGSIKLTIGQVRDSFESKGYTLLSKEYINSKTKLDYRCPKGHEHSIIWNSWQRGHRCSICYGKNIKFTIDQVRSYFEQEKYILLSKEYINSSTKLDYQCSNGHKHSIKFNSWKNGDRCSTCAGNTKLILEQVIESFKNEDYTLLSKDYINSRTKLDYRCPEGHEHSIVWNAWQRGNRCPTCAGQTKPTLTQVKYSFAKEGYVLLSKDYINNKIKLDYRCSEGHEHSMNLVNWNNGHRCITCCTLSRFGSNHPNWQGGISFEPYCEIWRDKAYKQDIRNRDGNRCLNPACNKNGSKLHIHHIDYNKKNCNPNNLITVCNSCNSSANKDRDWHTTWYQAIIKNRYYGGTKWH
jgi:membrane-bound inhibitor of C-type lysozyme